MNNLIEKQAKVVNRKLIENLVQIIQTFEKLVNFICNQENAH